MALQTILPPPPFAETGVAITESCVTVFKSKVVVTVGLSTKVPVVEAFAGDVLVASLLVPPAP